MTNIFKKYTSGVFCMESDNDDFKHLDETIIETKHGKEVDVIVWKKLFTKEGKTYYSVVRADGLNRSEWLKRKAEKKRNSADRQKELSDSYYLKSRKDSEFLSLCEPIKVGHHSENRHRKMIDQANKNMGKCCEADSKAKEYNQKAETLEIKSKTEINIDTPDCIPALVEKIEMLEAKKKAIKDSGVYGSYQLTNLGAKIRRYKDRFKSAKNLWEI